jgi:hypothetical protein
VVVLWSPRSVDSHWVRAEANIAYRSKTLIPATIEPCEKPLMFELTQTAELSNWRGDAGDPAWQAFYSDVQRMLRAGQISADIVVNDKNWNARIPESKMATKRDRGTRFDGVSEHDRYMRQIVRSLTRQQLEALRTGVCTLVAWRTLRQIGLSEDVVRGPNSGWHRWLPVWSELGNFVREHLSRRSDVDGTDAAH